MPNGGSDCCGTCWFNRKNGGERGIASRTESAEPHFCEIRGFRVEAPFYTYCANHPHRRPNRDPIPIGPVTRYAGDGMSNDREVWLDSPDTEGIRLHLLALLDEFFTNVAVDFYPIGQSLGDALIWQLGQFRERRAEERMQWLCDNAPEIWGDVEGAALARIRGEV